MSMLYAPYVVPNPQEVATIAVGSGGIAGGTGPIFKFDQWESVWVQHRAQEPYPHFQFVAAEGTPPDVWTSLQIKPGDPVEILLGGDLAAMGFVLRRTTNYDANTHSVTLYGIGIQFWAMRASVLSDSGSFDNMTLEQVARAVTAPFGIGVKVIGELDQTPMKNVQVNKGESIWTFLSRLANNHNAIAGSDYAGNFVLTGDHPAIPLAELTEGVNILRCQAVISIENMWSQIIADGQSAASDDHNMGDAASQRATATGGLQFYSPLLITMDEPSWTIGLVQMRAMTEAKWTKGTMISATIVVQGWMKPNTNELWEAAEYVFVHSPMAMLDDVMGIQTVTFTQDNESGTLTTLEVVLPWMLNGTGLPLDPSTPTAPDQSTVNTGPPQTAPTGVEGTATPAPEDI